MKAAVKTSLTSYEKKLIQAEIEKQIAETKNLHAHRMDVLILYCLHATFGAGKKKLKMFYDNFTVEQDKLLEHYMMGREDLVWLAERELLKIGVDVNEWEAEYENRRATTGDSENPKQEREGLSQ